MLPFDVRTITVARSKYLPSHNRGIPVPKAPTTIGGHLRRRRLELKMHQSQAALKMGVSTVTLSRWECDKVYPTWEQQPKVAAFLGFNPFTNPALGGYKRNETDDVAILSPETHSNLGQKIVERSVACRSTIKKFAQELGLSPKTIRNWETNRRSPNPTLRCKVEKLLNGGEKPSSNGPAQDSVNC